MHQKATASQSIGNIDDFRTRASTHGVEGDRIDGLTYVASRSIGHGELSATAVQTSERIDSIVISERISVLDAIADPIIDRYARPQENIPLGTKPNPTPVSNLGGTPSCLGSTSIKDGVKVSSFTHEDRIAQSICN